MSKMGNLLIIPLLAACLWPAAARAGIVTIPHYYYEVLLDTDSDTATGGSVPVVQGSESPHTIPGIDYIVRAYAGNDPGPKVFYRDVLKWNGASFELVDEDTSVYPIAVDGFAKVEFGSPWEAIGSPTGTIRGVFHASRVNVDANDYTAAFDFSLRSAPAISTAGLAALALLLLAAGGFALSRRRGNPAFLALAVMLAAAPVVRAAGIVLDGNFDDWAGINPVVTDAGGDSSISDPAEDILAGYVAVQGTEVFFRVDLAAAPPPEM